MSTADLIAYQGEKGCYSESAVFELLGQNAGGLPCESFDVAFEAVASGKAAYALMPIENSLGGSIHANYDLLLKHQLSIVGEINFRVRHSIMAMPGVKLENVKHVLSHYQALAQCDGYIRKLGKDVKARTTYDTAGSAKMIAQEKMTDCAAICSAHAAKIYGLNVLDTGIEDDKTNYTRFILLSRTPINPTAPTEGSPSPCKTSIVLTLPNAPGALYKVLAAFSLRDIDLTKVESRPISASALSAAIGHLCKNESDDLTSWGARSSYVCAESQADPARLRRAKKELGQSKFQYLFYLDFVGSVNDENVRSALRHLEEMVAAYRVLGSFLRDGNLLGPAALLKRRLSEIGRSSETTTAVSTSTRPTQADVGASKTLDGSVLADRPPLRVGIVGFGRFGQFLGETFNRQIGVSVSACSRSDYTDVASKMGVTFYRSVEELLSAGVDVLILSMSILSFAKVISHLPADALAASNPLVVDVLSVKVHAKTTMLASLPKRLDLLCLHPMFGPDSAAANGGNWRGLPLVFDEVRVSNADRCRRFLSVWSSEGCRMVRMTCEQHDLYAAASQFVTHFTGRVLGELKDQWGLDSTPINTSGFESLLQVMDNTCNDSWDLFVALYKFNPAAQRQLDAMLDAFRCVRMKLRDKSSSASDDCARPLSSTVEQISPSKTVALNDRCNALIRQGKDIVNLSVGEPHFQPPPIVLKELHSAIDAMKLDYTPVRGTPRLLGAIAEYMRRQGHAQMTPENIVTTTGAKFAIWLSLSVICEPGSEVVVIAPYWTSYPEIVKLCGGKPVVVSSDVGGGAFPLQKVLGAINARTCAVIVCNPNNPTGAVYSGDEMRTFAKAMQRSDRAHVWIVSDEIYERLDYVGHFESFGSISGMSERTVTINGFSKGFGMTGLRLGWLAGPKAVAAAAAKMQSQTTHAPCSLSQEAGAVALETKAYESTMAPRYKEVETRRDLLISIMKKKLPHGDPGVRYANPDGAFYVFVDVAYLLKDGRRKIEDLCLFLMEKHGVCVVPGSAFGRDTGFRVAYCKRDIKRLEKGIHRLCDGILAFAKE